MKPFSLEEYLKNPNQKVVTRDGRNVKIHCTNYYTRQPIIAEIEGIDYSTSFLSNGRFLNGEESINDLFFATEKHEGWVNIYPGSIKYAGEIYDTENDAKNSASSCVVATIKIEWEE